MRTVFVRFGTGEDFLPRLLEEFEATKATGAVVVSAVGSFSEVVYGEGYLRSDGVLDMRQVQRNGVFETGGLSGTLGRDEEGIAVCHVHSVFATPEGAVIGGHMFSARVLLTLEIALLVPEEIGWRMAPHDSEPHVPMGVPRVAFLPN
jgi:predicted DNA-binding protein with PD1-like motif